MMRALRVSGLCLGSLAFTLFLAASAALAQDSSPTAQADTITGWWYRWINFAIVIVVIVWAFSKGAPAFRARSKEISEQIAEGARARDSAEQRKREAQAKMAAIPQEVAELRAQAKRAEEAEAQRIAELARREVQTIEHALQAEIAAAERAARIELKIWAARMAIDRAEVVLRKEITPQAEGTLFSTFVAELQESRN
jgi:F-type H+-transporting ATPase subunit b